MESVDFDNTCFLTIICAENTGDCQIVSCDNEGDVFQVLSDYLLWNIRAITEYQLDAITRGFSEAKDLEECLELLNSDSVLEDPDMIIECFYKFCPIYVWFKVIDCNSYGRLWFEGQGGDNS